jgi:hypothetical protein
LYKARTTTMVATATRATRMTRTRGRRSGCGQDQKKEEEEMEGWKKERTDGRRIDWRDQSHCEIDSKDDEEEKPSARARARGRRDDAPTTMDHPCVYF